MRAQGGSGVRVRVDPSPLPLFLVAWAQRILVMSAVQAFFTSSVGACRMTVLLLDLRLLNQISNCSPLFPAVSVRPTSAVCRGRSLVSAAGGDLDSEGGGDSP